MFTDLIYDGQARADILKAFPDAKFTDASDFIHEGRFEVELETTRRDWYLFLIREGWGEVSLGLQLDIRMLKHKDDLKWALNTLDREKTIKELECPAEQAEVLKAILETAQNESELGDTVKGFVIDANRRRITLNGKFVAEYGDRFFVAERYHETAQQAADAL